MVVDAVLCVLAKAMLHACSAPPPGTKQHFRVDPSTAHNGADRAGRTRQGGDVKAGKKVMGQRRRGRCEDVGDPQNAGLAPRSIFEELFVSEAGLRRRKS